MHCRGIAPVGRRLCGSAALPCVNNPDLPPWRPWSERIGPVVAARPRKWGRRVPVFHISPLNQALGMRFRGTPGYFWGLSRVCDQLSRLTYCTP